MTRQLDTCDHKNAVVELLDYDKPSYWADAHAFINDDTESLPTLVCYACGYEEILSYSLEDNHNG